MLLSKRLLPVPSAAAICVLLAILMIGCGGPRTLRLTDTRHQKLDHDDRVDLYVGVIDTPHEEIAVIESEASPYVDDDVKRQQIEELQRKARRLGANGVQDLRILTKYVRGYTMDERVPFTAWKQGQYALYFMRGTAVSIEEIKPSRFEDLEPKGGWVIDRYDRPIPLETALMEIPMPAPRPQ